MEFFQDLCTRGLSASCGRCSREGQAPRPAGHQAASSDGGDQSIMAQLRPTVVDAGEIQFQSSAKRPGGPQQQQRPAAKQHYPHYATDYTPWSDSHAGTPLAVYSAHARRAQAASANGLAAPAAGSLDSIRQSARGRGAPGAIDAALKGGTKKVAASRALGSHITPGEATLREPREAPIDVPPWPGETSVFEAPDAAGQHAVCHKIAAPCTVALRPTDPCKTLDLAAVNPERGAGGLQPDGGDRSGGCVRPELRLAGDT